MNDRISFRTNDGWGWFSFVENNVLIIGESYPHEGGTLYRGEYKGDDTPYLLSLKNDDPEQYNCIVKYFKEHKPETKDNTPSETVKIVLTCPNCGNSTWVERADYDFECLACGDIYNAEDMGHKIEKIK